MIITCPDCSTKFTVNASAFPATGRKVKCARCGHVWHCAPAAAVAAALPAAVTAAASGPASDAVIASIVPAAPQAEPKAEMIWAGSDIPRRGPGHTLMWSVAGATFALTVAGLLIFREAIARTMPVMGGVYAALGFQIDVTGLNLSIEARSMETSQGDGVVTLVVTGKVANVTQEERKVPRILATILGKDRKELHSWEFDSGVATLKPGESHDFKQVLAKPPADTYQVYAHFADLSE